MADDRTILLKVELDTSALEKTAKDAAEKITNLKARQKELREEGKQDGVEYKKLQVEIQKYNKELTNSVKAIQAAEVRQTANTGSLREMRDELANAKLVYQQFSKEQRESAEGKEFVSAMKDLKDSINEVEQSFGTFTGSVGNYEGAIKKVLSEMEKTEKQINTIGFAYGANQKKIEDNTKALANLEAEGKTNTIGFQNMKAEIEDLTNEMSSQEEELNNLNSSYEKQKIVLSDVSEQAKKVGFVYGQTAEQSELMQKSFEDIATSTDSLESKFEQLNGKVAVTPKTLNGLNAQMEAYKAIALQAGEANDNVIKKQAIEAAAALKDQYMDLEREVNNLANDQKNLQGAMEIGQTAIASVGLYHSAMAALGIEGEEFEEMLIKLQAAQTALSSLQQISVVIQKQSAAAQLLQAQASRVQAAAMAISNKLFAEGSVAAKTFSKALIATGIGAIVAGLGLLIANFDKIKASLSSVSEEQAILNEHLDDYKQGATDAITKTNQVEAAFDLAKRGVISKEEALQTYNETLGDSFGQMTNLNDAEATFIDKKEAFIQASAERALAQALFAKAAEEEANAMTANMDSQIGTLDVLTVKYQEYFGNREVAAKIEKKFQKEGVEEAQKTGFARAKLLMEQGKNYFASAEAIEEANGITSESERNLDDDRKKRAADQKKRQEEELKAAQAIADRIRELAVQERELTLSDERAILEAHYEFLETIAEDNADGLLEIEAKKNADLRALELKELEQSETAIAEKYAKEIEAAKGNAELIAAIEKAKAAEIDSIRLEANNKFVQREIELIEKQKALDAQRLANERTVNEEVKILALELALEKVKGSEMEFEAWKALQDERITQLQRYRDAELAIETKTAGEKEKIETATALQIEQIRNQEFAQEKANSEKNTAERRALALTYIGIAQQTSDTIFQIIKNGIQQELNAITEQYDTDSGLLQDQLDAQLITETEFIAQKSALDETFRAEQSKLKTEQFKRDQAAAIISATIAASTAVLNALASPPPTSFVLAGVAAGIGATQIGLIASQPTPVFAKGGLAKEGVFGGNLHSGGGTKGVFSDGTKIEVERDEAFFILNRKATAAINALSNHNVSHGGAPMYADGGLAFTGAGAFASSQTNQAVQRFSDQNAIVDIVKALPTPVVPVESIVNATGKHLKVVDSGEF